MEYLSYGHEFLISIILLLLVAHVILDLVPSFYRGFCDAFVSAPVTTSGRFLLIASAFFLL